jgi:hypothetical protein
VCWNLVLTKGSVSRAPRSHWLLVHTRTPAGLAPQVQLPQLSFWSPLVDVRAQVNLGVCPVQLPLSAWSEVVWAKQLEEVSATVKGRTAMGVMVSEARSMPALDSSEKDGRHRGKAPAKQLEGLD